jgi:ABC-type amino acid transport substrate-binding protein
VRRFRSAVQRHARRFRPRCRPHDGDRESLGATAEFIPYEGTDFNGISDALNVGAYDCVTAGTTVTPEREKMAAFVPPYLISGQSLAVDTRRLPHLTSIDDLGGLTIGDQQGNSSQPIADRLVTEGKAAAVRVYDYGTIRSALTDLTTGGCDAFINSRLFSPNS